jgi:succinyl-diaminopimelate desuccinylase
MEVTNVTPGELKMMFNVRNNTHTDKEKIKNFIHEHFKDMNYTLELKQSAEPFITDPNTKVVKALDKAIQKETGINPKHSTAGGTSDARFFAKYGVKVVEFGVKNDTIHAPNERTSKDEVIKLGKIFKDVIEEWN